MAYLYRRRNPNGSSAGAGGGLRVGAPPEALKNVADWGSIILTVVGLFQLLKGRR